MNNDGQPIVAKRKVTSKIDYLPSTSTPTPAPHATRPALRSSPSLTAFSRTNISNPSPATTSSSYNTPTSAPTGRARARVNIANIPSPPLVSPGSSVSNGNHGGGAGYTASPLGNIGESFAYFGNNADINAEKTGPGSRRSDAAKSEIGGGKAQGKVVGGTTLKMGPVRSMTTSDQRQGGFAARGTPSGPPQMHRADTAGPTASGRRTPGLARTPSVQTLGTASTFSNEYATPPAQIRQGAQTRTTTVPVIARLPYSPDLSVSDKHSGSGALSVSPSSSVASSLHNGAGRQVRASLSSRVGTGAGKEFNRAASPIPPDPRDNAAVSPRLPHAPITAKYTPASGESTVSSGARTIKTGVARMSMESSAYDDGIGVYVRTRRNAPHEEDTEDDESEVRYTEVEWRDKESMRLRRALEAETDEERQAREKDEAERGIAEDAKKDRKIADLEISNQSLMTVNRTLEAAAARKDRLISSLKRQLRASERGGGDHMDLAFKPLKQRRSGRALRENADNCDGPADGDDSGSDEYTSDEDESLITRHGAAIDATLTKLNESLAAMTRRGREALDRVEATTEGEKGKVLGLLDLEGVGEGEDAMSGDEAGAATPGTSRRVMAASLRNFGQ